MLTAPLDTLRLRLDLRDNDVDSGNNGKTCTVFATTVLMLSLVSSSNRVRFCFDSNEEMEMGFAACVCELVVVNSQMIYFPSSSLSCFGLAPSPHMGIAHLD